MNVYRITLLVLRSISIVPLLFMIGEYANALFSLLRSIVFAIAGSAPDFNWWAFINPLHYVISFYLVWIFAPKLAKIAVSLKNAEQGAAANP